MIYKIVQVQSSDNSLFYYLSSGCNRTNIWETLEGVLTYMKRNNFNINYNYSDNIPYNCKCDDLFQGTKEELIQNYIEYLI